MSKDEEGKKSKNTKKYVIVDAVSTFHMRYVVELDKDSPKEWAHDSVVMGEAVEFSQKHLDETIVTSRSVSKKDALKLARKDNPEWSNHSDEKLFSTFITPMKETKPTKKASKPR